MTTDEILRNLHIDALTPMQTAMGEAWRTTTGDLVLLAPTGTGKTLAYLLPLVQALLPADGPGAPQPQHPDATPPGEGGVQALILTPTRELALQTAQVFKAMGTRLQIVSVYGGRPAMDEHRVIKSVHPQLIVGTPGRLCDHLAKGNIDPTTVRTLVIDEFDKCLELGFLDEMAEVINQLPNLSRRILLSATDAEEIPRFVGVGEAAGKDRGTAVHATTTVTATHTVNATHAVGAAHAVSATSAIHTTPATGTTPATRPPQHSPHALTRLDFLNPASHDGRLSVELVHAPQKDKLDTLYRLLCDLGQTQTLVFVGYRESADRVAGYLLAKGLPCDAFHGGLEQLERERALYKFAGGSVPVLVSTDLAARGLDLTGVDNVVHYHLPANHEAYTHRNGRTARWDATGRVFLILNPEEQLPDYIPAATPVHTLPATPQRPPQPRWATLYIGRGRKDKLSRADVCGFLCKQGQLQRDDLGRIDVRDRYAFAAVRRSRLAQLLTLVRGEKIKGMRTLIEEAR